MANRGTLVGDVRARVERPAQGITATQSRSVHILKHRRAERALSGCRGLAQGVLEECQGFVTKDHKESLTLGCGSAARLRAAARPRRRAAAPLPPAARMPAPPAAQVAVNAMRGVSPSRERSNMCQVAALPQAAARTPAPLAAQDTVVSTSRLMQLQDRAFKSYRHVAGSATACCSMCHLPQRSKDALANELHRRCATDFA